ncbi:MAG: RluA family pseudouridine synthase [Thermodesulfobacteriota bacterium]|nr:RluA family pseudouridine synthase [Thermodesulfobacteriota bacterium]
MEFVVSAKNHGQRLDCLVSLLFEKCSRSAASALVRSGDILVSKKIKKPGYRVKTGDVISADLDGPAEKNQHLEPESLTLQILYEDHHIAVLNKRAGMVVHPGAGNTSGTLANALVYHYPQLKRLEDKCRPGIVHRLDKDTSGVMVIAKTESAGVFLKKEFKLRRVSKRYLALAAGEFREDSGQITFSIGRHPVKRKKMSIASRRERPAVTLWQVKKRFRQAALVEVELKTGRTHQVRVHLSALGHPLLGDTVYGFRKKNIRLRDPGGQGHNLIPRHMLHAWKLSFLHPWSGQRVEFKAPLPNDFKRLIFSLDQEAFPV